MGDSLYVAGADLFPPTQSGVFRSTDNGKNWTQLNSGLTDTSVIALSAVGNVLFAGTDSSGVFRSTNGGAGWVQTGLDSVKVLSVVSDGPEILAGTIGLGFFVSRDSGATWSQTNNGLTNLSVVSLLLWKGAYLFASTTGGGVFSSSDSGLNWHDVSSGLPDTTVNSLFAIGDTIYAGTDAGMWERLATQMVTSVKEESPVTPQDFVLDQNYPNPFNPSTVIGFGVRSSGFVSLKVYDVLGRLVRTLVDRVESAGSYKVEFDAADLPSGVYFYRLEAGTYRKTRKMLLLK